MKVPDGSHERAMLAWAEFMENQKEFFYVIHNQIIACVQWYRVNIWKIYSVSKRKVFFQD